MFSKLLTKSMSRIRVVVTCLLLLPISAFAGSLTVEDFSKRPEFFNAKISPDGKHLAVLANHQGATNLVFFELPALKPIFSMPADGKNQAGEFYWANNERVVMQVLQNRGALEIPLNYGEIFAVNVDGKKAKMLFGYRAKSGLVVDAQAGHIMDLLPDDPKHILVYKSPMNKVSGTVPRVEKLNIYTGKTKRVKAAPMEGSGVLVDNNGVPRFAAGVDEAHNVKLFYSEGKGDRWQPLKQSFKGDFEPVVFGSDNQTVFGFKSEKGQPAELVKVDLKSDKIETVHASSRVKPTGLLRSNLNEIYGIRLDEDYPSYVYLDEKSRNAQLHKALFKAFNYQKLAITSRTDDGKTLILHVSGDTNPGSFYFFDTEKMQTKPLFNAISWLDSKQLSAMEPFRIKSKDGLELNGYLTVPKGKKKNLPLIVMPHGGPHARDYWGYDPQVQMLANAGYAVVQVNFRGSTGYGEKFMEAGYGEWGNAIQDDIYLAAQYAIQSGVADKDRVCISGGSFGGYSALQSAVKFPDFYKCAIGFVGVYDLPMLYNTGDIKDVKWGDAYLDKTLGTDETSQIAQSPVHNLDKLKAPVFIIHGKKDHRAAYEHAEVLRDALDKKGHSYEWLVKDKEGHGFYKEENVLEKNQKVLEFLNKHIGE